MNNKDKSIKCKSCRSFNKLYEKCVFSYIKTDAGICCLDQVIVNKDSKCEFYKKRINTEKAVALEHIDEVIKDIKILERIYYNDGC